VAVTREMDPRPWKKDAGKGEKVTQMMDLAEKERVKEAFGGGQEMRDEEFEMRKMFKK
jgi:hypothetical protein